MAKFLGRVPVSQMPCIVAKHRQEASDEEFESTWGKSKRQMHACGPVDPLDPEWNATEDEDDTLELPSYYDSSKDMPRAEMILNDERSLIPICAAHASEANDIVTRSKIALHGIRPRLNPGESENVNKLFFKWSRDRRDRVLKRRTENAKKYKQFDIARSENQQSNPNPNPNTTSPEEDVESYSDETPRSSSTWNLKNLVSTLFPEQNNEENEPDIYTSLPIEEFE